MKSQTRAADQAHQKADKVSSAPTTDADQVSDTVDAITLIKNDHREVESLFQRFDSCTSKADQETLAKQICTELIVHATLEEELLYPACRDAKVQSDMLDEAQVEHDGVKVFVAELMTQPVDSEFYHAKVTVLAEYVKHHVTEEEEPENGILAKAKRAGIDMNALGARFKARKEQLKRLAETDGFSPPIPRSLHPQSQPQRQDASEDKIMDRYSNTPDRDERGRFVSEDQRDGERSGRRYRDEDDRRYERGSSYQSSGRNHDEDHRPSSNRYDDDDRRQNSRSSGRGWSGDSERHAEAARKGWDERESPGRSNNRPEEDTRRQYRSRNDDDDRRSSGGSGWYGDPEGHAEAARRGWEEREPSRGRGRPEDDHDHRRNDERNGDERRGSSRSHDESHRGWYGDSEGHSEAARRGWDERETSARSHSRNDDDDRRRSRSYDDQGHGGWFGDSRGHSEASRRGWQNRDR